MAKLLLNLRNVPDDEANDVRALLEEHSISFYETRPSSWGVSSGGIWIEDNAVHVHAKELIDEYQRVRGEQARARHQQALLDGSAETFGSLLRRRPFFVLATLLGMVVVASLVLLPFVLLR